MKKNLVQIKFDDWYIPEPNSGCWLWLGSGIRYGQFQEDGVRHKAHRYSYQKHCGVIPDGVLVLHRCDNTFCVNPDHLFLGSQLDNMRDMIQKGRQHDRRGIKNSRAKFTIEEINAILSDDRYQYQIASDYGVSQSTIGRIKRKEVY